MITAKGLVCPRCRELALPPRGWVGQQQRPTAQQQDYEVQREMDLRMVEIGVRGHLSNQFFQHSYLALVGRS
jgi:hypothetical protein